MELRHPQTEAHLCQLAVLENFAEHGLYVKFSNEEAEQLEQEALALALAESTREASMLRCGHSCAKLFSFALVPQPGVECLNLVKPGGIE